MNGLELSNIILYIKIDLDESDDTTIVAISFHETSKKNSRPYSEALNESNTSRIYKHLSDDNSCAIISAYRGENSLKENKALHSALKKDIRNAGLGFIEFISRWVEDGESFDEESFLIPGMDKDLALELGKKYNQASIIYKSGKDCEEICTSSFETYKPGDIVRKFNNVGPGMLNLQSAEDIFSKRAGGPASKPKKGGKAFNLQVIEKLGPRPSYFKGAREQVILESNKFTLRESDEVNSMIDVMMDNDSLKDEPYVGSF